MGVLDAFVRGAFRDEPAGRVVVFRGGRRNRGYVVRSEAEELKIKSFLKMFYFAHFYILILGMMLANAWSTFVIHLEGRGRPAGHMVRNMSIVARPVLHDDVSAFQINSLGVIKLQPNLAFINYGVVDSVRLLHCRIFFFKVIG